MVTSPFEYSFTTDSSKVLVNYKVKVMQNDHLSKLENEIIIQAQMNTYL